MGSQVSLIGVQRRQEPLQHIQLGLMVLVVAHKESQTLITLEHLDHFKYGNSTKTTRQVRSNADERYLRQIPMQILAGI